jgi:hypothetical protein
MISFTPLSLSKIPLVESGGASGSERGGQNGIFKIRLKEGFVGKD